MKVLVSGASGLIGSALVESLRSRGDEVLALVRRPAESVKEIPWDPAGGRLDALAIEGVDAVVHLAGAGIGDKKWSPEQKARILDSRVEGTTLLARTLAGLTDKPKVLVSGSAIGFYGDRGDDELTEDSAGGEGFVPDVVRAWEGAASAASDAGIRVVTIRTGIVLAKHGGALARLLLPFKLGLGGRVGSGKQYMSWITLDDEVRAIEFALTHDALRGPVNLTAPNPATNAELTSTLGRVLHRPTILPTPLLPLKVIYGTELVNSLLVEGQRVLPSRLEAAGFEFRHPQLEEALRAVLAA